MFILSQEFYQCSRDYVRYLKSVWNYIDLSPLGFASFGPVLQLAGYDIRPHGATDDEEQIVDQHPRLRSIPSIIQVIASMLLWMKFLYYLRTQKEFGYLIRMITEVIRDMITFLVVMGVLIIAFSEASYSLSNNKFSSEHVLDDFFSAVTFTFYNAMGELSMDGFEDDYVAWALFFFCALFNLIVMLNLLIAIISDTYGKVASTQEEFALKERAGVVSDLRDFSFFRRFVKPKDPRNYLFIAINEEAEKLGDEDINIYDVHDKVVEMKKEIREIKAMA